MKILVIGGSYFFGRWFVQLAHDRHEVTVLNRGNIAVGLDGVRELKADRHDAGQLKGLSFKKEEFDVVVDFCAYMPGDISSLIDSLNIAGTGRYIFVSTVDVYRRGTGQILTEDSPLEDRMFKGEEGAYISGKVALETELMRECGHFGIIPVSVRPAVLYGPGNYAPRENLYIKWVEETGHIIHPEGADGYWQMIYVRDAAEAVLKLCTLPADELRKAYNLCDDELITFDTFETALSLAYESFSDRVPPFGKHIMSIGDITAEGMMFPFPLSAAESEHYSGRAFRELGIGTASLTEGLKGCIRVLHG
ncbi:MAG: NAD-dependent epimerase/dehydratase family protein [Lachnospiraceae bacterium]|nr:NAD-dependent epimerase/dehydratase family protein [Lachnospiraceae bacterium]